MRVNAGEIVGAQLCAGVGEVGHQIIGPHLEERRVVGHEGG